MEGSLGAAREQHLQHVNQAADQNASQPPRHEWLKALSDPAPARRVLALEVVCRFSGEHALDLVIGMLSDPDPCVRRAAASATERLGSVRSVSCLIVGLDDPDPSVRRACQRALEVVTKRSVDLAALHDPKRRSQLVAELVAWWKRERLAELLAD